jgi:hypothetical protein
LGRKVIASPKRQLLFTIFTPISDFFANLGPNPAYRHRDQLNDLPFVRHSRKKNCGDTPNHELKHREFSLWTGVEHVGFIA